jgi:WD40 repeat protein
MGVILAVTGRFETPKIPEDVEVPLWLLNLWMLCWNFEPDGRPRSEEVVAMIRAGMASEGMQTDGMNVIGHGMGHWTDATSPSSSTASSTPNLTPTIPITQSAVRLWDSVLCQEVTPFRAPPISDVVCCVSFSRSGAYIATGDYYAPNYVRIWSLETGKEVGRLEGHTGTVEFVGWKPKLGINAECEGADETVLSCGGDKTVRAWSLAQLGNPSKPERLEADEAPTSESTEVQTLSQTLWIHELQSWSWELEFSPSGNHVAIIDEEVAGKILDVSNGLELARFEYSEGMRLFSVAYSGDGRVVASGYKAGQICIWDASAIPATEHSNRESSTPPSYQLPLLQVLVPPQFHAGDRGVYGLEISPCNKILAAACGDEVIRLWSHSSSPSFCTLQELHGHTGVVNSVAFTADSKYLLSGSWDTTFRKWDVQSARGVMVKKCRARVFSVAVSPDGRYFLAGGG